MGSNFQLATEVAQRYASFQQVEAVALGGSLSSQMSDESSDIDLYVYVHQMLSLTERERVAQRATQKEIGNAFWEPGDEWHEGGVSVDVMFRPTSWVEDQLARVLDRHEASIGYTTCFWFNVLHSEILFDRKGWFEQLQHKASRPYPASLKRAIVAKNWPILRNNQSSYRHQIELAIKRHDQVSVQHRVTALLASYFDILFAINEQPHPGEKRLIRFAEQNCPFRPPDMEKRILGLVESPTLRAVDDLLDGLEQLLTKQRLI